MKSLKKCLSLVLAVVMLVCAFAPAFAYAESGIEGVKQYKTMTVFGDSIPCACGLPTSTSFGVAENSYYDIVSKAVGAAPYTSLAYNGSSIPQVMYLLGMDVPEEDIETAEFFLSRTGGAVPWNEVVDVKEGRNGAIGDVTEVLKNSELICIALGSNDIATIPFKLAKYRYDDLTKAGVSQVEALAEAAKELTARMTDGVDCFINCYPKIIEKLQSLNPDATIVLIGAYNPFEKITLKEDGILNGSLLSSATKLQNAQLAIWAKQYGCIYVDMFEMSESFGSKTVGRLIEEDAALDTHPTYEGHAWMAQQILNALPRETEELTYPRNTEAQLIINGIDAGRYELEFELIGWTIKDVATGKYLSIDTDSNITESDTAMLWGYNGGFFAIHLAKINSTWGFSYFGLKRHYIAADDLGALTAVSQKPTTVMLAYN